MATRKALALISGLLQEINTPTDKVDFAGNTTTDLAEGSNLYYLDSRSRSSISASNTGTGYGSLTYSSLTGIITYSVVTNANIWGSLSAASGSGLTYNTSTGQFGTSAIPNSQLANSSITFGSTSVSLGGSSSSISGLTGVTSTTLTGSTSIVLGTVGGANSIVLDSTGIVFEGATADANKVTINTVDPTGIRTITLPDASGTVALLNSLSVANSGTGFGSISYNSGTGVLTYNVVTSANVRGTLSASTTGTGYGSLTYNSSTGNYDFAVVTDSNIRGTLSVAVGSGLTYNSTSGQFGTSSIPNSQLANSSIILGSTSISLGSSALTVSGLTSISATSLYAGILGSANSLYLDSTTGALTFEGSTANAFVTKLVVTDPTATRTVTLSDQSGTVALNTNKLSFFSSTTSAELAGVISDETGTGVLVFSSSPSLTTPTIGSAGANFTGSSSGTTSLAASATASGVLTLPAATDTLVGKDTTDIFTNKTFDTAGTGNVFKINGTSITAVTGTGAVVLQTSPTLVTPLLGTPTSGTLTNCTGLPISTGISGLATGIATFLATPTSSNLASAVTDETGTGALVFANTPTLISPVLGTPTSGTLTNCTGLPVSTGISGLATGIATFLATPTSSNLASAVTDETGTGSLVFATSPSFVTPVLGAATATTVNKVTITAPATGSTLTIADGKTLTASNTLTFQGTDGSTITFGAGGSVAYLGANNAFSGANTFTNTSGQTFRQASTQDGVIINGRAGGTSSYSVTFTPAALTSSRTLTIPDETATIASQDFATAIAIALG